MCGPSYTSLLLMRLARFLAASNRGEWLDAMDNELPHIPARNQTSFAAGCFTNHLHERLRMTAKLPPLIIIPGLLGSALLSVLCLANGIRLFGEAPVLGGILLVAALLWGAMFWAVHAQSSSNVARLAVGGLSFYAAIGLAGLLRAPAFSDNSAFFQALALEGLFLFGAAMVIAFIPVFWVDSRLAS